jgi:hypothetical protein
MTLLGLHRLENAGGKSPFDENRVLEALLEDRQWMNNIGDVGLMLWLLAEIAPDRLKHFYYEMELDRALEKYPGVSDGLTMELAWYLAGLSHAALAARSHLPDLTDQAVGIYRPLLHNQGPSGIFEHQTSRKSVKGLLRGKIGSFADQVYPIYAMSHFARAFEIEGSAHAARRCADVICRMQGPLGQWWWHYDSPSGRVVRGYPVYSVHQHAMGPMALYALSDVTGQDFSGPISKGLRWIYGENELGVDMRDISTSVVWRRIHPANKSQMLIDDIFGMLRTRRNAKTGQDMAILYECWPYELGWLLYAFAGRATP